MEKIGQINSYYCKDCRRDTYTINLHNGTTPFCIICPVCRGLDCFSSFYNLRIDGKININECFYRPVPEDFDKLDWYAREHVLNGGLLHAPIGTVKIVPDKVDEKLTIEQFNALMEKTYKCSLKK